MVFGSLQECIAYIKKCQVTASQKMAKETKREAKNIIDDELIVAPTGRTRQTPKIISSSGTRMEVELVDIGGWHSWLTGEAVFSIPVLEAGFTIRTPGQRLGESANPTHIMDNWENWASATLPNIYLETMRSQGVPIG